MRKKSRTRKNIYTSNGQEKIKTENINNTQMEQK